MTWLTWRQFRIQAWVALAALAILAAALAVTGPGLAHLYATSGIDTCHSHGNCDAAISAFLNEARGGGTTGALYFLGIGIMFVVPAVVGVFWGAPLVAREMEAGTHRLVWNQSVTRTRWLAIKLGLVGVVSMATAGLFSLMVTWWADPIDRVVMNRMTPEIFAARGVAPIGYAAFAFALGVAAGVVIRRAVPAMAVTLAVFAFVQIAMPLWIRPHLMTPVRAVTQLDTSTLSQLLIMDETGRMKVIGAANQPGAWVLSNQTVTTAGQEFSGPADPRACGHDASPKACMDWVDSLRLRQVLTYQPASRYWAFQWSETTIFLALALLLTGFCFWWVRPRRLS
jgi:hypothetical protein